MAKVFSAILVGVSIQIIEIEATVGNGFSGLSLLGMPADSARDTRERVRSALEQYGVRVPSRRIVVSMTPSESLRLARSPLGELDFPVAAAIVLAMEKERNMVICENDFFLGSLSLSGQIRPLASQLLKEGVYHLLPEGARLFSPEGRNGFKTFGDWLERRFLQPASTKVPQFEQAKTPDVATVAAILQEYTESPDLMVTLMAAAAGGHSLLLAGEPGTGKTYAAKSLAHLLPPLSREESIEVQLIGMGRSVSVSRPVRSPHHSSTAAALVGGAHLKPGEVTLAHRGLLILDELAEYSRGSLEALREPLDSGSVCLSRANGEIHYPASFQLVATTNPCPCGFLFSSKISCRCRMADVKKYHQKLSGPIMDRFCLQVFVGHFPGELPFNPFMQFIKEYIHQNPDTWAIKLAERLQKIQSLAYRKQYDESLMHVFLSRRGAKQMGALSMTLKGLFPEVVVADEVIVSLFRQVEQKITEVNAMSG